eukprot:scaffold1355_cov154-Ochromonas_danica.AAC.16
MSSPLTSGSAHSQYFAWMALSASIFSTAASVLMLWLIIKVNHWSGHVVLITTMTIFQTIYDVSFYSAVVDVHVPAISITSNVAQIIGGISSSLMSNVIAAVAYYVILYRRSFPIFRFFPHILGLTLSLACLDALLFLLSVTLKGFETLADVSVLGIYYYGRLLSIGMNFFLAILTLAQARRSSHNNEESKTHCQRMIQQLSFRLFFYPIIQAISRSGCAWYEMQYGYSFSSGRGYNFSPEHTSSWAFAAQCTMAISMPIASVGYLIVFLNMQPKALRVLKHALCWPRSPSEEVIPLLEENGDEEDDTFDDSCSLSQRSLWGVNEDEESFRARSLTSIASCTDSHQMKMRDE